MTEWRKGFVVALALPLAAMAMPAAASGQDGSSANNSTLPGDLPEAQAEHLTVTLDLATLMRVPKETSTLVIGNPTIADAAVQRNGLIVVTGKSYGTTNLLMLDKDGETLREVMVSVKAPSSANLIVQRGVDRETYSCHPRCQQTLTLGDSEKYFGEVNSQTSARNAAAQNGGR
jgi:hypothetical protein